MRITVQKPRDGRTTVSLVHQGAVVRFRRVLKDIAVADMNQLVAAALKEWEDEKNAIRANPSS